MALQLIKLHAYPNESEIAVTKAGGVVTDGAFFLDFSQPLEHRRWLGVRNNWIGFTVALFIAPQDLASVHRLATVRSWPGC